MAYRGERDEHGVYLSVKLSRRRFSNKLRIRRLVDTLHQLVTQPAEDLELSSKHRAELEDIIVERFME